VSRGMGWFGWYSAGFVAGALTVLMVKVPPSPPPASPQPTPPPASRVTDSETLAAWEAQALVSNLLDCRRHRVRMACQRTPGVVRTPEQIGECLSAEQAVLGDGVFEKLKVLRSDRYAQRMLAARALNECQRLGGDDMSRMLDQRLPQ
jgi:hypothetical protein